jgi:hypothetical protein
VFDTSGNGNNGTVSGAKRVAGKSGAALRFDGVNDLVTVADSASLDLTDAMTVEAWVKPTALGSMWRTIAIKEQKNQLAYALYAGNGKGRPSGHVYTTRDMAVAGGKAVSRNSWTHVATTWDGRVLRLLVNGTEVAKASLTRRAANSSLPLRFGGNTVWKEWFKGAIDEMRIYNRALTPAELNSDSTTSVATSQRTTGAQIRTVAPTSVKPKAMSKKAKARARAKAKARARARARKHRRAKAHVTRWMH